MARKVRSKGRQVHPTGPLETVDDDDKTVIREAMVAKSWDQKDLAEAIPVSEASITNLMKPGPRQIRFKTRLYEVLGIPGAGIDDIVRRIVRKLKRAERSQGEALERVLDEMIRK